MAWTVCQKNIKISKDWCSEKIMVYISFKVQGSCEKLQHFTDALHGEYAISLFEDPENTELWHLEILFSPPFDRLDWIQSEAFAFSEHPELAAQFLEEEIADQDWLLLNQKQLSPLSLGRFYIHSHSYPPAASPDLISLQIEAATAFGSGYHETTQGCLYLLQDLFLRSSWKKAWDVGCGSGILTLAANALISESTIGSDLDPEAILVAKENAVQNEIPSDFFVAAGIEHPQSKLLISETPQKQTGMVDLIIANILLKPLQDLAPSFSVVPVLILSGFLDFQEKALLDFYPQFQIEQRFEKNHWVALCLRHQESC
jgi:ribosomal protein L11 methyltransferase